MNDSISYKEELSELDLSASKLPYIRRKILILGGQGVGKTSIIKRYLNDKFDINETSTLSMSYVGKLIELDNKKIQLNIWDTIGQEKYRSISKLFLNETKIVVLVYSITSEQSFNELDYWYNLYKDLLGEETILGIAGNKMDLYLEQVVSDEKGKEFADSRGAFFALVSAKENKESIDRFIETLLKAYLNKNSPKNENNVEKNTIKLEDKKIEDNQKEDGCCMGKKKKKKNDSDCINSIFLGEKGVGKTSLIKRIEGKEFNEKEKPTNKTNDIVIEYKKNKLKIYDIQNDKMDTKDIINIISDCKIYFLVYNIKEKETLESLEDIIKNIKKYKQDNNYLTVIIANKKDKEEEGIGGDNQKENIEEGKKLANENNAIFKMTSAMDNIGLENILGETIEKYLNKS